MFKHEEITKDIDRAKRYFENIISFTVGPFTLEDMIKHRLDAINIADVRNYEHYIDGHLPYAMHIPIESIKEHLEMLDKSKVTILYTYNDSCVRAYDAALMLLEKKYPCVVLRGGYKEWKKYDLDIVKTSSEK